MFKQIPEDEAVIVERGVYRTAKVYVYKGSLFVGAKGGMVRVKSDGSTSHPTVRLESLHREGPLFQDRFGRLTVEQSDTDTPVFLTPDGLPVPFDALTQTKKLPAK